MTLLKIAKRLRLADFFIILSRPFVRFTNPLSNNCPTMWLLHYNFSILIRLTQAIHVSINMSLQLPTVM